MQGHASEGEVHLLSASCVLGTVMAGTHHTVLAQAACKSEMAVLTLQGTWHFSLCVLPSSP